jgi:hypothetical protein
MVAIVAADIKSTHSLYLPVATLWMEHSLEKIEHSLGGVFLTVADVRGAGVNYLR